MSAVPHDLSLVYHWVGASMPPPFHYEYDVRIGATGEGEVVFWPDYPQAGVPEWREGFCVLAEDVAQLYRQLLADGLLERRAQSQPEDSIGGEKEWLTVHAGDATIELPPSASDTRRVTRLSDLYASMRSLVPKAAWDGLEERRAAYAEACERRAEAGQSAGAVAHPGEDMPAEEG